jgi:acetolactate synthase-1/2/3 large subunit
MGFGLPAAIGAALEHPDKNIVCISGDGSIMMNMQELATAVECNINLKIFVLNNQSLGLVRQQQKLFYGDHIIASEYQQKTDLAAIARGFGIPACDVTEASCLDSLLKTTFETSGPALVNIPIDRNEDVFPMVPPGAANSEMLGEQYECA